MFWHDDLKGIFQITLSLTRAAKGGGGVNILETLVFWGSGQAIADL